MPYINWINHTRFSLKIILFVAFTAISLQCFSYPPGKPVINPALARKNITQKMSKLLFTENRGQIVDDKGKRRSDILFTAHSGAMQLFLTATGIHYQLIKVTGTEGYGEKQTKDFMYPSVNKPTKKEICTFSVSLAGANPNPTIRKEMKSDYTENFYTTGYLNGITGVNTYERIVYENVYPNVDWIIYSKGDKLKYDFLVRPGGDPQQIKLKIDNAQNVSIPTSGDLVVKTMLGDVKEQSPISYAGDSPVKTAFKKNDDSTIGFVVGTYNGTLRIDPAVEWVVDFGLNTYTAMPGNCAIDNSGNVFVTGFTSQCVVYTNGYQDTSAGGWDMYLVKYDSSGNLIWGTYYGGVNDDYGQSCSTDGYGNVYMAGYVKSPGLATPGSYQDTLQGLTDPFLAKFNSNGVRIWATYFGHNGGNYGSCKADKAGNVYLTGVTWAGIGIATNNSYYTYGFLVKFDSSGSRLWGTYCGGNVDGFMNAVDIDPLGNIFVAGATSSTTGLATSGTYQPNYAGYLDGFVMKFDSLGNQLWGTYFGGNESDMIYGIYADSYGNVYATGFTYSTNGIASVNCWDSTYTGGGYSESFLAKFDATGNRDWSTYYGGTNSVGFSTTSDQFDNIYFSGYTNSLTGIASPGAYQDSLLGGYNGYIAMFDTGGQRHWGTYTNKGLTGSAPNKYGNVYFAGLEWLVKLFNPPSLFTGTISDSLLCAGDTIAISYTITDTFSVTNIFTAELSDSAGSFLSPVPIGAIAGNQAGTITGIIPLNTPTGNKYRIRVSSSNPLTTGKDNGSNIVITAQPGQPDSFIVSTASVCQGEQNVFYIIPPDSTVVHTWSYSGTGANITGGDDSVSVNFSNSATSGLLQVLAANRCGVAVPRSINIVVNTNPVISVSGHNIVCQGNTDTLTGQGADTYEWYPPNTLSAGSGTSVIAYPVGLITYTVVGVTNGCNDTTTFTVNISALPNDSIAIDSPYMLCSGGQLKLQTISYPGYQYQWQLNDSNITGANMYDYYASSGGSYNVHVTDTLGCIGITPEISLDTVGSPAPTITFNNGLLCTTGGGAYQWYLDGVELSGATTPCIKPVKNGNYTVWVTNTSGCSGISPQFWLFPVGLTLYPNPANNVLYVSAPESVNVQIYTIDGRKVVYVEDAKAIDLHELPNAVYMIKAYDSNGTLLKSEKLVKTEL